MHCWTCGTEYEMPLNGKLSFRAACDKCGAALHCCKNCIYYKPGLPNDCVVPDTDFIADREKNNFCEEFSPLGKAPNPKNLDAKKRFEDLFG